jgi:hypothetical protein
MNHAQPTPFRPQFAINYHASMTYSACPEDSKISQADLVMIVASNVMTDMNQFESALHFDNCCFSLGVQRINDLWADISPTGVLDFVVFGTMIHTVQDFYAHSNWVELNVDDSPIPVWDLTLASLPSAIVSGTFFLDWPKNCGPDAPTHAQLNKDSPDSEEGQKIVESGPNLGKSLFDLAYDTALRATQVQFARLLSVL